MPKKYRLTGEEIQNLSGKRSLPSAKKLHGRFFSLFVAPVSGTSAKCAVVVSKKTSAKAVDRNRIKRRARNMLAKCMSSVEKPLVLIFYAKREAKDASFSDLERDIEALFSKL